jgi:hypothetical protein
MDFGERVRAGCHRRKRSIRIELRHRIKLEQPPGAGLHDEHRDLRAAPPTNESEQHRQRQSLPTSIHTPARSGLGDIDFPMRSGAASLGGLFHSTSDRESARDKVRRWARPLELRVTACPFAEFVAVAGKEDDVRGGTRLDRLSSRVSLSRAASLRPDFCGPNRTTEATLESREECIGAHGAVTQGAAPRRFPARYRAR